MIDIIILLDNYGMLIQLTGTRQNNQNKGDFATASEPVFGCFDRFRHCFSMFRNYL
jgi:hypothetical protein